MVRRPILDEHDKDDIIERTRELAPHYVDNWDVESDDAGTALLKIFAEMGEDITERLNQTPVKHRVMFLDMLDFSPNPPQPASIPVTFQVAKNAPENVVIPGNTTVEAVETKEQPSQRFETVGDEFEATPASISDLFAVDGGIDRIVPHHEILEYDISKTMFSGENQQTHALYFGDREILDIEDGTRLELQIRTNAPPEAIRDFLEWEFYGENDAGEEGWHSLTVHDREGGEVPSVSEIAHVRELIEKLELVLPHAAYTTVTDETPVFLLKILADEIREGRFDRAGRTEHKGLPSTLVDPRELDDDTCRKIGRQLDQLRQRLRRMADGEAFGKDFETVTLELTVPGELTAGAVSGIGGFWLRARFPVDDLSHAMFNTLIESVSVAVHPPADDDEDGADDEGGTGDGDGGTGGEDPGGEVADDETEAAEETTAGVADERTEEDESNRQRPEINPLEPRVDTETEQIDKQPEDTTQVAKIDRLVANRTEFNPEDERKIPLFGNIPRVGFVVSFACTEAFEPGTDVILEFEHASDNPDADGGNDPQLIWEYSAKKGWKPLSVEDTTSELRTSGTVSFEVPADIDSITVQDWNDHWVRARLIAGDYGQPRFEEVEAGDWQQVTDHINAPVYRNIRLVYEQSVDEQEETVEDEPEAAEPDEEAEPPEPDPEPAQPPEPPSPPQPEPREFSYIVTENNLTLTEVAADGEPYSPFRAPPVDTQALYLGFDRPLRGGPLNFYFPITESLYPPAFDPLIDVEYCTNPRRDQWQRTGISDGTDNLTERGILELTVPKPTTELERFGVTRHWLRITVTGDRFARTEQSLFVPETDVEDSVRVREVLSYQSLASREAQSYTRLPPAFDGLYPNTQWAKNIESVTDEVVGSSDGTAGQTFEMRDAPVLSAEVWVNEYMALSDRMAQRLIDDRSTTVEEVYDGDGHLSKLWVKWTEVPDFIGSEPESRHYVLKETEGKVLFGDGREGAIPPEGENNVKVDYETGGGSEGNKQVGTVDTLIDPIQNIKGVTNHEPGKAGEPAEPLADFVKRAPKNLRDRGKPITRDGFVRITKSISREIDRVRCIAGEDETETPGKVILVIVPDRTQRKPLPSEELIHRVEDEMNERVPAAVVSGSRSNLTIRGPNYVEASVTATVASTGSRSATTVTDQATTELTEFAHPLTGGPENTGWEIGSLPEPSLFAAQLEKLDAVDHVKELAVTYSEGDRQLTVALGEDSPDVAPDILVCSGRHNVTVDAGGEQ